MIPPKPILCPPAEERAGDGYDEEMERPVVEAEFKFGKIRPRSRDPVAPAQRRRHSVVE